MKKIALASDLHQDELYLTALEVLSDDNWNVFVLGDIVDSHVKHPDPVGYLERFIFLARKYNWKVFRGNHDHTYFSHTILPISGVQVEHHPGFNALFNDNIDLFQMAHIEDTLLLSHAGFCHDYVKEMALKYGAISVEDIVEITNQLPRQASFCSATNGGRDDYSGPLWLRPWEYNTPIFPEYRQMVGHTHQQGIVREKHNMTIIDTGMPYLIY